MRFSACATSWLLATGIAHAATLPAVSDYPQVIETRKEYHKWAKDHGMCRSFSDKENAARPLKVPGPEVLAKFEDCVAKNEFQEELQDTSGDIFCQRQLIHLVADAANHKDSKLFVDRPSNMSGPGVNASLNGLIQGSSGLIVGDFLARMNQSFGLQDPDRDLLLYNNSRFPHTPAFIARIRPQARILRAWTKIVHHYWNLLDRQMNQVFENKYLIPGPGSTSLKGSGEPEPYTTSAIRLEHPFVIAGGRFREQYYWDSFFVMEGLLAANMSYLARTTLLNFMDQIKAYGFIPNGARKYYLNRSQPPLFIHMLHAYVHNTNDTHILHEALPLAERELRWWSNNRSVTVTHEDNEYKVYQYRVTATGPRPESYAEDWRSAWCYRDEPPNETEETELYSEFASGAESGWDYTVRWMDDPFDFPKDKLDQMRNLKIRRIVPVDLNSIIYRCHELMARLYDLARDNESPFADQIARRHEGEAKKLRAAILALHWDPERLVFFDYILGNEAEAANGARKGERRRFWSGASLAPYWSGIWPDELGCGDAPNKAKVMKAFSGVRDLLMDYPGPLPATLVKSGQQWDFPNAWPPLQYIAIKALESIPEKCIEGTTVRNFLKVQTPEGHLGDAELPESTSHSSLGKYATWPSWRDALVKTVVMRYITATFCTWNNEAKFPADRAEIVVQHNPARDAALTNHTGHMFEKLNAAEPFRPGGGGEYEVQTGFGWTNGIAIWIAHQYGAILDDPSCNPAHSEQVQVPPEEELVFQF